MKIKIINPNITDSMTTSIRKAAESIAQKGTQIYAVNPSIGPESIECYVDEYLAIPGVLEEILQGDRQENADAYIIACFGDPGLQAAREITKKPVLGIAQSAMMVGTLLAPNFSIVLGLQRSVKVTGDLVKQYGMESFCCSIRSTGLSVLDFGKDFERGLEALALQSRLAVSEDRAECILLGCAGFVDFVENLKQELGVPVLDGVAPAVKMAEALVSMGLCTSKHTTWSYPEKKKYSGYPFLDGTEMVK